MRGPIARATLRTSVVLFVRLLAQAGTLLLIARLLGPELFGAFAGVAALAVLLGGASTFGMHLVLLREMSRSLRRRGDVLPMALGTTVVCGTALLLLFVFVAWLALEPLDIGLNVVLCIGVAELLIQPLMALIGVDYQARGKIERSQLCLNMPLLLRLGAAALIWIADAPHPLNTYAWAYLGSSALALVIGLHSLRYRWPRPARWQLVRRVEWRNASGFAVLNVTALGPTELDKALALRLLPLELAGVYSASARVIGAAVLPISALVISALPRLFRESEQARGGRLLRWIFAVSLAYGIAATIGLRLAAPLLEWLFGPKYQGISEILYWLTIAVPGMALRFAAGAALMARGSPWWRAGVETIGIAVLCVMAPLLISVYPIQAMPIALACAEWSMAVVGWSVLGSTLSRVHPGRATT
jgi:O-antigen/teichoic acid export membrane protein